jgi:hypothetical protein
VHAISELDVNNGLGDRYEAYHLLFKAFLYFDAIVELYSVRFRLKPKIRCYYRHNHRDGTKKKQTRIEPLVKRKRENSSSKFLSLSFFLTWLYLFLYPPG